MKNKRLERQLAILFPYMSKAEKGIAAKFVEDEEEHKLKLFTDTIWRMI